MKIKDDEAFVWAACAETRLTVRDQIVRCGQECIVQRRDDSDGLLLCLFSDCKSVWFPKSCVVEDELEEPMQILPDDAASPAKTLRDEIAMSVLSGYLASFPDDADIKPEHMRNIAEFCYLMSDAMMEARKK